MMDLKEFIGLPFETWGRTYDGCDCWGLVHLFYRDHLGIDIPDYIETGFTDYNKNERELVSSVIDAGKNTWKSVQLNETQYGDVIIFALMGYPVHVGIALNNKDMLHTQEVTNSCIDRYKSFRWQKRITEIYRHASRIS